MPPRPEAAVAPVGAVPVGGVRPLARRAPIAQYVPMPHPDVVVVQTEEARIVGGTAVSVPVTGGEPKRKHGDRGHDNVKRQARTCKRCDHNKGTNGKICRGRHPRTGQEKCEYFTVDGVATAQ